MISTPAVSSPPWASRSAISASVITRLPPTGIGQPTEWASVASIKPAPAAVNDGIREITWAATPVNRARASSPPSDPHAGVPWASIRSPRISARRQRAWHRTLVAEQQSHHGIGALDQWAQQAAPRRTALQLGTGSLEIAVGDCRGPTRQRVGIGDLRHGQLHPACGQIERREKRRRQRQRVNRRAHVVQDSRRVLVGRGAGAAAEGRLRLDDLHFQARAGADDRRRQPVGPAADDGDVHRSIRADRSAYSLVG